MGKRLRKEYANYSVGRTEHGIVSGVDRVPAGSALRELYTLIAEKVEQEDRDALVDFFSLADRSRSTQGPASAAGARIPLDFVEARRSCPRSNAGSDVRVAYRSCAAATALLSITSRLQPTCGTVRPSGAEAGTGLRPLGRTHHALDHHGCDAGEYGLGHRRCQDIGDRI